MPPEALKKRRFSEKSDVWAFGVTAWEMLTDGEVPFAFIASNEAVAERVCGGERLARPDGCDDPLWALLLRTWAARPADRPTFTELAGELAHLDVSGPATVASGVDVSDAAPPPLTWEGVRAQLTQLGYPATACVGCTPIEGPGEIATCYHSKDSRSLLCSVCHHWVGRTLALEDPSATREMLRTKAPSPMVGSFESRARAIKPVLDAAFPADAYMSEAHLRHLKNAITRNFASLTPGALAHMFDELGDRSFISAAQAADLLATIKACSDFEHYKHFHYYHVICHRILDRWNTTSEAHGIGDCYYGWSGDHHRVLEAARTGVGPRSNREIRVYVQNKLFMHGELRFQESSYSDNLPGFYTSLLRRLGD
jgi:serine/threonine protein kinase